MTTVFTIGHSNLSVEAFFALLEQHENALLGDVRTSPYSWYVPSSIGSCSRQERFGAGFSDATWGRTSAGVPVTPPCFLCATKVPWPSFRHARRLNLDPAKRGKTVDTDVNTE